MGLIGNIIARDDIAWGWGGGGVRFIVPNRYYLEISLRVGVVSE